jgi:hypothetical protein
MKLPYVIDNQTHVLAEILKDLLTEHRGDGEPSNQTIVVIAPGHEIEEVP